ncbi:Carboxylic ester hydrolase [Caenorhabditis elegans]|uniref:Carboxylic ester hydrolase n=1 Tax=Caenorhabditis elegans TaxID=6239 RepID=O16497_CAEEL|nr:Carboxylic ester hydrolase [Caenorhabditis elegans]CCD61484.1 Carboxylic ester hydrolase [Caenorhabditis elegans]|eukprot:NP_504400.1 Carboxylic ester hydrolase [Caenorhabditis elegans]
MGGFLSHLKPEHNTEVLNASCGPIRGNIYEHDDKIVDGYLGIPFAKAPIGELRFKKSVEAEKWTEPLDCYKYGPGCPQSGALGAMIVPQASAIREFAEDNCLTLNVFAPKWKSAEFPNGLPVIVYFYGGGFEVGFSSMFDDYSLTGTLPLKDVILVTPNYRIGPLGFFATGDDVSRGNWGLWDQALALQWVQKHIKSFGGDPSNVTISGTSAGGASVDFLSLSPHANKYFHKFIPMSGAATCPFGIRSKDVEGLIFREFAKHHGYAGNDSESLLHWYQSQDAEIFLKAEGFKYPASGMFSFVPNYDGDFFPKPFDELRKEAPKLDAIVSVAEYEGLGFEEFYPGQKSPQEVLTAALGPEVVRNREEVVKKAVEAYLENIEDKSGEKIGKKLVEIFGDYYFSVGVFDTVRSLAKYGNNVYLSSFNYFNPETPIMFGENRPFNAASHGCDIRYILGDGIGEFSKEDRKVMDMMGTYLTNFAKYGNPNGKGVSIPWEKYSLDNPGRYFKIDYPKCEMADNFLDGRYKIIDEVNEHGIQYQEMVFGKIL